jgi:hypothetical protein
MRCTSNASNDRFFAPIIAINERPSLLTGLIMSMIGMLAAALAGCQSPKHVCVVTPNDLVECNEVVP